MKSLMWILIHDWFPYKQRKVGHKNGQSKGEVITQRKTPHEEEGRGWSNISIIIKDCQQ